MLALLWSNFPGKQMPTRKHNLEAFFARPAPNEIMVPSVTRPVRMDAGGRSARRASAGYARHPRC